MTTKDLQSAIETLRLPHNWIWAMQRLKLRRSWERVNTFRRFLSFGGGAIFVLSLVAGVIFYPNFSVNVAALAVFAALVVGLVVLDGRENALVSSWNRLDSQLEERAPIAVAVFDIRTVSRHFLMLVVDARREPTIRAEFVSRFGGNHEGWLRRVAPNAPGALGVIVSAKAFTFANAASFNSGLPAILDVLYATDVWTLNEDEITGVTGMVSAWEEKAVRATE